MRASPPLHLAKSSTGTPGCVPALRSASLAQAPRYQTNRKPCDSALPVLLSPAGRPFIISVPPLFATGDGHLSGVGFACPLAPHNGG